jgi:hypothetical protein
LLSSFLRPQDIPQGSAPELGTVTMADFERLIAKRGGIKGGVDAKLAQHFAEWTKMFGEEGS